jgi:hypothetical protein
MRALPARICSRMPTTNGTRVCTLAIIVCDRQSFWRANCFQIWCVASTSPLTQHTQCHNLDTENAQWLALQLAVSVRNLRNELTRAHSVRHGGTDSALLTLLNTLCASIARVVDDCKKLVGWLDR